MPDGVWQPIVGFRDSAQARQQRSRSPRRVLTWAKYDIVRITGPNNCWQNWFNGWQPRFWTGHPDDPESDRVKWYEFPIHKPWEPYVIQEVHVQQAPPYFVSARILVQRKDDLTKSKLVWTNVSKGGELWAEKLTT